MGLQDQAVLSVDEVAVETAQVAHVVDLLDGDSELGEETAGYWECTMCLDWSCPESVVDIVVGSAVCSAVGSVVGSVVCSAVGSGVDFAVGFAVE